MIARVAASAALALLMSACPDPRSGPKVELRIVHTDEISASESPQNAVPQLASAQMVAGELLVRGIILVPDPCDALRVQTVSDGEVFTLHIVARLSRGHAGRCDTAGRATLLHYHATVRGLPHGAERVRVFHDYQGLPESDPAAPRWADHVAFEGPIGAL